MSPKIKRTCAFFTFGCKVNQYETQLIREEFIANGFTETKENPSFYIVNGCTVTSRADKKCSSLLKSLFRKNPRAKIILTGCYAQNIKVKRLEPENVSCIIPQDKKSSVFHVVESKFGKLFESIHAPAHLLSDFNNLEKGIREFNGHNRAFVKIQDGCDNFCTYCIVPFMRGAPWSRPLAEVFNEVKLLSEKGFKEIVLCGINLGTWGREFMPGLKINNLVKALSTLGDLKRLRLSSIELKYVDDSLIEALGGDLKLCHHLHIPLQSGDSFILKKMHRDYSASEYLNTLSRIRSKVKDISFTTDIMVGFPGESDLHFNNTLDIVKKAEFTRVHVFTFSPRSGTSAANMPQQVDAQTKRQRRLVLEDVVAKTSLVARKDLLNKELSVLFEQRENDCWCGYSDSYVYVKVPTTKNLENIIQKVKVVSMNLTETIARV